MTLTVSQARPFCWCVMNLVLARSHLTALTLAHRLANGILHNGRVVCPWHNACFSARSGALLNAPGQDNLTTFPVQLQGNTVYVEIPENYTEQVPPPAVSADASDERTFVIVGGGAAGNAAAQMLRQVDYKGKLVMLSADSALPYDRTKLSKAFLQADSMPEIPSAS